MYDVAIVGGGMAGMAAAIRMQARGLGAIVLEAHALPGGCAGFYRRQGFSFDVGATTLVDFDEEGIGGQFLAAVGIDSLDAQRLPGYVAWLPDRRITLSRDSAAWRAHRAATLGDSSMHRQFWGIMDRLAEVFWRAARHGAGLPIRGPLDAVRAIQAVGPMHLHLARYLRWTTGDLLGACNLRHDRPLVALLSMLIEDTVHGAIDTAPLINSALGVTIRGAGLTRARGGMRGFWMALLRRYRALGGQFRAACAVDRIESRADRFILQTAAGPIETRQVVAAVPADIVSRIAPAPVREWLAPYLRRDASAMGGAIAVCLGVPEWQVAGETFTHHQLMHDYDGPLGNGNNMFISVSAADDLESAPAGWRSVMISTHCELAPWENLPPAEYAEKKRATGSRLIALARRVYPNLAAPARVIETATPLTYRRFTSRSRGAVGGARQTLGNSNQHAIAHQSPLPGFWLAGDSTWPGLGTVACLLSSQIVADGACARAAHARGAIVRNVVGPFVPRVLSFSPFSPRKGNVP